MVPAMRQLFCARRECRGGIGSAAHRLRRRVQPRKLGRVGVRADDIPRGAARLAGYIYHRPDMVAAHRPDAGRGPSAVRRADSRLLPSQLSAPVDVGRGKGQRHKDNDLQRVQVFRLHTRLRGQRQPNARRPPP